MTTNDNPVDYILYDIASGPPVRPYAPNPLKTRYALNFKGVDYRTEWVELPNVPSVRQSLGVPANRVHADGSPHYTLPIIKNTKTGEVIGDTYEIAVYLDQHHPERPTLIPPLTKGLHAAFNTQVDRAFDTYAILFLALPFNPETAEQSKATFAQRAGKTSWDDISCEGEDRVKMLEAFKTSLGNLTKYYAQTDGLFLEGDTPTYADLIVGGWLGMMKETLREWEELRTEWHDGLWGRLHEAIQKYAQVK